MVWSLQLVLFLGLVAAASADLYNVNRFMDDWLKSLSDRVIASQRITVPLGSVTVGKWSLEDAQLADLSSLTRAGDSWMWSQGRTIYLNGTLRLGAMFVVARQARTPQRNILQPIVTVKKNMMSFLGTLDLSKKGSCQVNFSMGWPVIAGVTIYPGDEGHPLDLGNLVVKYKDQVEQHLTPPVTALLENSAICTSQWLQHIEMVKYNAIHSSQVK